METSYIIISIVGGFFAGILNTLAGFGSIITLAIYMELLGIPGHLANATNRINVMGSSGISAITFYKNGKLEINLGKWIIATVSLGAILGVILATQIDGAQFKVIFHYILVPILVILLLNPKKFINVDNITPPTTKAITYPLYFLIGIYAGFIQAGFGVIFLLIVVILSKYPLIKAQGLKIAIVAIYTILAIIIFQYKGMIVWKAGLIMAIGQSIGGYVTARYLTRYEGATKWAYYGIILIVVLVIIKNFEVWKWFG